MHDVIVVGAGPAGSQTAASLAQRGYTVLVLEEHPQVGAPTNCSGLIGAEAFERFDLPRASVIRGFDSATFFSPKGSSATVGASRVMAYVVRRCEFDQTMAQRALACGASYLLRVRCVGLEYGDDHVKVAAVQRGPEGDEAPMTLSARAVVLATGVRYGLLQNLGLERPSRFLQAAQVEVGMEGVDRVEVYLGREVAPGSFAWAIPAGPLARVGVCNGAGAVPSLKRFLQHPSIASRICEPAGHIKKKAIPIANVSRSFRDRILLVGDAAGQVKVTTGGGISYGILCGDTAAATLDRAFCLGDLSERSLVEYERRWRQEIGVELRVGSFFRRVGGMLSDEQIDRLIRAYHDSDLPELVKRWADFERHRKFILALCRSGVFFQFVWSCFRRSSPS
ncbi:MAG: NAD(P)/FAD-dependent oxidoreductase [candidate division NC10 bacterium]|nr:NAD(P)/FAD-dependent oxidoreductase [candidate division NC10 bacterium]